MLQNKKKGWQNYFYGKVLKPKKFETNSVFLICHFYWKTNKQTTN